MMGKLLKYDLKCMTKKIVPLWIAMLVLAGMMLLSSVLNISASSIGNWSNFVILVAFIAVGVSIFVVNLLMIIQRFWNGLLKDEGYLMFTLPVSTRKLILSKAFSGMIITIGSFIVGVMTIFIFTLMVMNAYTGTIDGEMIMKPVNELINAISAEPVSSLVLIVLVVLEVLCGIYKFYAAMSIGHLSNQNRFLCSFGAYIALSIAISGIISGISFVANVSMDTIVTTTNTAASDLMQSLMLICVQIVQILVFHVITEFILTRKLNLE